MIHHGRRATASIEFAGGGRHSDGLGHRARRMMAQRHARVHEGSRIRPAPTAAGDNRRMPATDDLLQFGALGKAFSILEAITSSSKPLAMAELARVTGMSKPSAHRIVTLLAGLGFIERDHANRGYVEGPRLVTFALSTLRSGALRAVRHAILRALAEELGETCNFGVLAGSEVVYIDRVEAKWPLGIAFDVGTRVPAHCSAIGKLLLSLEDDERRRDLLRAMPLTDHTPNTITSPEALAEALSAIRAQETGFDDEEYIQGVVCVAVPVRAADGTLIGGIAVSAPRARLSLEQARAFVPRMRGAAERLGATFKSGV